MNRSAGRLVTATLCGFFLITDSPSDATTVRLVAVAVNGERFAEPLDAIDAVPGDTIEVEILVSGVEQDLDALTAWQIIVDNGAMVKFDLPAHCGEIRPIYLNARDAALRRNGAFISHESAGRGVCSAESANPGATCVLAPSECEGKCFGGQDHGDPCDAGCPGGECSDPSCIGTICSRDSLNYADLCSSAEDQCAGGACEGRDDFIGDSASSTPICSIDTSSSLPDYRFGCTAFHDEGAPALGTCIGGSGAGASCDDDIDCPGGGCNLLGSYAGTVILEVGEYAMGTYAYDANTLPGRTFFADQDLHAPVTTVPLGIRVLEDSCGRAVGGCCVVLGECDDLLRLACEDVGGVFLGDMVFCDDVPVACPCPSIIDSYPANCENDARYPHQPDELPSCPQCRIGFDTFDLTLSPGTEMSVVRPESFQLRFMGAAHIIRPKPASIVFLGGTDVRVHFDKTFPVNHWTCMAMACAEDSAIDACWNHLPGDVNNSGASNAIDALELIDFLNGLVDLEYYQCDIDNSGACVASDILAVIGLLNGADNFFPWNNETQPAPCPTEP